VLNFGQLLLSRLLLPTRRRVQRFTLFINNSGPKYWELDGPDLSRPDARLLRDLRTSHDATLSLSDLVEHLQETVEQLRAQTSAIKAIIAAAKKRLGEKETMANR
jgi:hypothetical protein